MSNEYKNMVTYIARAGYCAKSVVYSLLGCMIVYAALYAGSVENISKKDIFEKIDSSMFGSIILFLVLVGLACYVIWRLVQFLLNPEDLDKHKPMELTTRIFYCISALLYVSVAYTAFNVLYNSTEQSQSSQTLVAQLLQHPFGVYLIAGVGAIIIVFAGIQLKHAIKQDFIAKFDRTQLSDKQRRAIYLSGRIGFTGRAIVYVIIGGFITIAAIEHDPSQAGGLSDALMIILNKPFGPYLLAAVGICMFAFGVFCGFEGRYRVTKKQ